MVIDLAGTVVAFTMTAANVDKRDVFKANRPSAGRHKRTFGILPHGEIGSSIRSNTPRTAR
jgi:hypothetical protein